MRVYHYLILKFILANNKGNVSAYICMCKRVQWNRQYTIYFNVNGLCVVYDLLQHEGVNMSLWRSAGKVALHEITVDTRPPLPWSSSHVDSDSDKFIRFSTSYKETTEQTKKIA